MNLARGFLLEGAFQLVHIHAVRFHGHAMEANLIGTEGIQGADKAGFLADHHIPLVAQGLGEQVHHLLRAGGDEDIVKIAAHIVGLFHVGGHRFPQGNISLGLAVLQGVHRALCHDTGGDFRNGLFGEGFRRRIAGR